ncbi:amino acid ABC transporter substrate-binding protein (PAAT family) [Kribbella voronezhensis]|uniref:Amino acid ABC transporter substrate-binding protein (PAAT family) n=1 Tax=Kribbella voronezhensis TaxID=2512212 RepID=A0A4R7THC6_9ACTN|nr:glutamate ABC transporter substrate-binding protein [Kribbella voronezhensis]TDU91036.1 amino acid ABC transporter substrate-binding protein (PAAT family) [Kribbella voronezhensis]
MKKQLIAAGVAAALLALTACGSSSYEATPVPTKPVPVETPPAPGTLPLKCDNALASYAPEGALPSPDQFPAGSYMAQIKQRGRLIAGVSADSLHLGSRNPISGDIEGFDIDMIKAVAQALGVPVELRVISSPQRLPVLIDGSVDIVARNMTINCDRWSQIAFSAEYYRSGQKSLVPLSSTAKSLNDLPPGTAICTPTGSTSYTNLRKNFRLLKAVTADTDGGCLVLFQQGKVFGISGDDTVLAGDAAQDPYARVIKGERFSDEPYGLGMSKKHPEFVRFVNGVLEQIKADGRWKASYNKWFAADLGPAPAPPKAVYGRVPE